MSGILPKNESERSFTLLIKKTSSGYARPFDRMPVEYTLANSPVKE